MSQAQIESPAASQRLVYRNALLLVVAQVAGTPLSILINAVMARHLGLEEFGVLYLAWTYASFAGLAAEWGQGGALPAMVARDRSRAGELLGSGLVYRVVAWIASYGVLALGCHLLGVKVDFQMVLAFVVVNGAVGGLVGAGLDTIRGLERTDITALANIAGQVLTALFVIPTLLLGGRVHAVLTAQIAAGTLIGFFVWRSLRPTGVGGLSVRMATIKTLLVAGTPFLFFGLAMALQPNVDAVFLHKFATEEAVGWYAASRKLVGVLIFPASALLTALYPTLCRLFTEDAQAFRDTARSALRMITVLVVPVAVGCALFPEVGIAIFSRNAFGPACDDLRVLSIFVLLVYFTMTLGTCLLAAGRQRLWALIQCLCVAVSAALDPLLVPWFQTKMGNGGLGTCVSSVASEICMTAAGIWLTPRGIFDRTLLRQLGLAIVAGGAMATVGIFLRGLSPFVAAPISAIAYGGCLVLIGGFDKEQLATVRGILSRKLARR